MQFIYRRNQEKKSFIYAIESPEYQQALQMHTLHIYIQCKTWTLV